MTGFVVISYGTAPYVAYAWTTDQLLARGPGFCKLFMLLLLSECEREGGPFSLSAQVSSWTYLLWCFLTSR